MKQQTKWHGRYGKGIDSKSKGFKHIQATGKFLKNNRKKILINITSSFDLSIEDLRNIVNGVIEGIQLFN